MSNYVLEITLSKNDLERMLENGEKIVLFRWVDDGYGLKQRNDDRVVFQNLLVWYSFEPAMFMKRIWTDEYYFFMSQYFDGNNIVMNSFQNVDSRKQYEFKNKLFNETSMEGQLIQGAYYLLNNSGNQLSFGLAQKNYENTTSQDSPLYPLNIRKLANGSATYFKVFDKIGVSVTPSVQPGQLINIDSSQIIVKDVSVKTDQESFLENSFFSLSLNDEI